MKRPPRTESPCETPPKTWQPLPPPARPTPKCDPPEDPVEPTYDTPERTPAAPELPTFPAPYIFRSLRDERACDEWPAYVANPAGGEPQTISAGIAEEGEFELPLYLQTLGFSSTELQYIAEALAHSEADSYALIAEGSAEALAFLCNISIAKAQLIIDAATTIKRELAARAEAAAFARLQCRWGNSELVLSCPDDALTVENGNPVTVAADSFYSESSKADADARALAVAQAALQCEWASTEVIVHCSDLDPELLYALDPGQYDEGAEEIIQEETVDAPRRRHPDDFNRWRINTVIIPAGSFTSDISRAVANTAAADYGITLLDCFFTNGEQTVVCPLESGEVPPLEHPITYDGNAKGNPVVIEPHTVASDTSWAQANELAITLATESLNCAWSSARVVYSCDDLLSDPTIPEQVAAHAVDLVVDPLALDFEDTLAFRNKQPHSIYMTAYGREMDFYAIPDHPDASYSSDVEAGAFTSTISQADADQMAAILALSQIRCIYCNPDIVPACDDTSAITYTRAVPGVRYAFYPMLDAEGNPLETSSGSPLYHELPTVSGEEELTHLEEGLADLATFCGSDPFQVASSSDLAGSIPESAMVGLGRGSSCEYGNDLVIAMCDVAGVFLLPDLPSEFVAAGGSNVSEENAADLSVLSSSGPVYIARDTVRSYSKADANLQATKLAQSMLDCFWENSEVVEFCADAAGVSPSSSGSTATPVTVAAQTIRSYISKTHAQEAATALAVAQLNCFWENDPQLVECSREACLHPDAVTDISVDAGVFTSSVSKGEANFLARAHALSQLYCVWGNKPVRLFCGAPEHPTYAECATVLNWMAGPAGTGALCLHSSSIGDFSSPVIVAADSFMSEIGPDEANRAAWSFALSQLDCVWGNARLQVECGALGAAVFPDDCLTTPVVDGGDPEVDPDSIGSGSNPVIVEEDSFLSKISPGEANRQAYAIALASLDCYYSNDTQTETCLFGGAGLAPGGVVEFTVPEKQLTSKKSKAAVNEEAKLLAKASLVCLYCNSPQTSDEVCPPNCHLFNDSTVPECTVISAFNQADANAMAKAMALAFAFCRSNDGLHFCNDGGGGDGSDSGDGGGGGGDGDSDSSSGSGGGDDGSSGGSGSDSGSGKDNAIVPAPWLGADGFVAVYVHEMPEVRLSDVMVIPVHNGRAVGEIDPRFLEVCEPETVEVLSAQGDTGLVISARRSGGFVLLEVDAERPPHVVTVTIGGIRKGFLGKRFPRKTRRQYEANELSINSHYPADIYDNE